MFFKKAAIVGSFAAMAFMPLAAHAQADAQQGNLGLDTIQNSAALGGSSSFSAEQQAGYGENNTAGVFGVLTAVSAMLMIVLIPVIAIYVFLVIVLIRVLQKTGVPNGWLVVIPFVAPFKSSKAAGLSYWWGMLSLLLFIFYVLQRPLLVVLCAFVVLVFEVYKWARISARLGLSKWLGLLMLVPLVNIAFIAYLAFSKDAAMHHAA